MYSIIFIYIISKRYYNNIYNLTIIVLANNNLKMLGNKIVDTKQIKIPKARIPKINKFKKQKGTNCGIFIK